MLVLLILGQMDTLTIEFEPHDEFLFMMSFTEVMTL